jgi:hypothetical protein
MTRLLALSRSFVTLVTLSRTGPASLGSICEMASLRLSLCTVPTSSLAVEIDQTLLNWLLAKPAPLE